MSKIKIRGHFKLEVIADPIRYYFNGFGQVRFDKLLQDANRLAYLMNGKVYIRFSSKMNKVEEDNKIAELENA